MMRRIALPLAAAALAATAPLALSAPGTEELTKAPVSVGGTSAGYTSHGGATTKRTRTSAALRTAKAERRKRARIARRAKFGKPVNLVLKGCVVDDVVAGGGGVDLDTIKGNTPMRRLLGGTDTFHAPLSDTTRVVLSEAAQMEHGEDGSLGTIEDLWAGDRVVVRWRVARGTAADELPAAIRVVNQGPHEDCAPDLGEEIPEDVADDVPAEEPLTEEPAAAEPLTQPADRAADHGDDDCGDRAHEDDDDLDDLDEDDDDHHHRRGRR
jgi:hypothetical protein